MKRVKVFGLQRSGTNYLREVLRLNFDVEIIDGHGWKHGLPDEYYRDQTFKKMKRSIWQTIEGLGVCPLIIYKDYRHWLDSIKRNPANFYKKRNRPEHFYFVFHTEWSVKIAEEDFLHYEDFLLAYEGIVDNLGRVIGIKPKSYIEPKNVKNSEDWKPEHKLRYIQR